jgi:hypothetical protein
VASAAVPAAASSILDPVSLKVLDIADRFVHHAPKFLAEDDAVIHEIVPRIHVGRVVVDTLFQKLWRTNYSISEA